MLLNIIAHIMQQFFFLSPIQCYDSSFPSMYSHLTRCKVMCYKITGILQPSSKMLIIMSCHHDLGSTDASS